MANTLCTPTCFGFPTESGSGLPTSPVICKGGELVVRSPKIRQASRQGTQQDFNVGITTGQTYDGAVVTASVTNPWDIACLTIVHHEFSYTMSIADADAWEYVGVLACSGGALLYTGGASGTFQLEVQNGTNYANDDRVITRSEQTTFTMYYTVPASVSFSIQQTTRLHLTNIRSGFRALNALNGAMTVDFQPRYP